MSAYELSAGEAIAKLKGDVEAFLSDNRAFFADQGKKLNSYFEMACYNHIVIFYRKQNYTIKVENLISKSFRYKLSTSGYPENFSFFSLTKKTNLNESIEFEVHHNLCIQSAIDKNIFLTPDIAVVNANSIVRDSEHYLRGNMKKFCYAQNEDLQTFCEVKQYNPFPELLYSFMGLYAELYPHVTNEAKMNDAPKHISPSLIISGKGNLHTDKIKSSLESRGSLNILFDVFQRGKYIFNTSTPVRLKQVSARNYLYKKGPNIEKADDGNDELPF